MLQKIKRQAFVDKYLSYGSDFVCSYYNLSKDTVEKLIDRAAEDQLVEFLVVMKDESENIR